MVSIASDTISIYNHLNEISMPARCTGTGTDIGVQKVAVPTQRERWLCDMCA